MTGEKFSYSAEFACGQLLFNLKNSQLNYLVKETPYSAYITIRKKLIKSFDKEALEPVASDPIDVNENIKKIERENSRLRERNIDVEREHALLKIDFEEFEIKFEELKDINDNLEEKNEELIQENSKLEKLNAVYANNLDKDKVKFNNSKIEESRRTKEQSDLVDILEATVESKKIEVNDLKEQLSDALLEIQNVKEYSKDIQQYKFNCESCEYMASTEAQLQEHKVKHEQICKFCESKFKTLETLGKHTCKLNISNSEFKQFYIKNWILTHGCSGIFDKHLSKEVAILHNETCWNHVCPCRELPGWHYSGGESLHDGNGILHAARSEFIENGVVHWSTLCKEFED